MAWPSGSGGMQIRGQGLMSGTHHKSSQRPDVSEEGHGVNILKDILRGEEGQDMVEYTLLLAFVALAAGAAYVTIGNKISGIWVKAQTDIASAAAAAH